jgi:hypothetical protein
MAFNAHHWPAANSAAHTVADYFQAMIAAEEDPKRERSDGNAPDAPDPIHRL